ncbi:hypothetical protein RIR_jg12985.t1 [Rhizophagus irregularis DAOM 181602=DAOM 197198]|nr:hypothetical protein RIR_jg12985.t1 [Rhizophagus irregularis DAOM 181602=DAOM 197198]
MEEIEQLLNEQMQIELTSEGKEIEEKFKNIEEEIFNLLETKEGKKGDHRIIESVQKGTKEIVEMTNGIDDTLKGNEQELVIEKRKGE